MPWKRSVLHHRNKLHSCIVKFLGGVNVKVDISPKATPAEILMRPRVSPFFVAVIVRYVMVIYQVAAVCVITFLTLEEGKKEIMA